MTSLDVDSVGNYDFSQSGFMSDVVNKPIVLGHTVEVSEIGSKG